MMYVPSRNFVDNFLALTVRAERTIAEAREQTARTAAPWTTAISTDHHAPKEFDGVSVAKQCDWVDYR